MARTLEDLARGLEDRAKSLPQLGNRIAIRTAIELVTGLANETPVDTSKAISNWVVTLDRIPISDIDAHFEGSKGDTFTRSSRQTIMLAKIALLNKKPGQTIFITNNADYIRDLNNGSSPQAPANFVQSIVKRIRATIKRKGRGDLNGGR